MELSVLLQIKQMAYVWMLIGNVLLALWALGLYVFGRSTVGEFYFRVVVFFQVLVALSIVVGIMLLSGGVGTNPGHLLYAFLNGFLGLARVGWHGRLMRAGRPGLLWLAFLAVMAIALVARSAVTAH